MMNVDPEAEVASITEAMTEALSTVTTSQITYAARDSLTSTALRSIRVTIWP